MNRSKRTEFEPSFDTQLRRLDFKQPSDDLDGRVLASAEPDRGGSTRAATPRQSGSGFGWPVLATTVLLAVMLGFFMGYSLPNQTETFVPLKKSSATTAVLSDSSIEGATRSLTNSSAGLDGFRWIHGHSGQDHFKECSTCHDFDQTEKRHCRSFYDRQILSQERRVLNCSMCHSDGLHDFWLSKSNG